MRQLCRDLSLELIAQAVAVAGTAAGVPRCQRGTASPSDLRGQRNAPGLSNMLDALLNNNLPTAGFDKDIAKGELTS